MPHTQLHLALAHLGRPHLERVIEACRDDARGLAGAGGGDRRDARYTVRVTRQTTNLISLSDTTHIA